MLLYKVGDCGNHSGDGSRGGADGEPLGELACISLWLGRNYHFRARCRLFSLAHLVHCAVHVDDIGASLLGSCSESSCLIDIIAGALAFLVSHCVRIEHIAADLHGVGVFRHYDAVVLSKHEVKV